MVIAKPGAAPGSIAARGPAALTGRRLEAATVQLQGQTQGSHPKGRGRKRNKPGSGTVLKQ